MAESLAAVGDRIIAVGSNKDLACLVGPRTCRLNLEGRTVLPGFIDAHEHLSQFSAISLQLDFSASKINNVEELLELVRSQVERLPDGEWVRGLLYDDTKMSDGRTLTREDLDAGVRVAGSSDHPCGLHPPLLGVRCMVTGKTASGDVIGPDQKISIEEAIKMYTVYAAYASFEEDIKGSLAVGRLADMVVLAQDPWTVDPEDIGQIGVNMTILGGRVVYGHL